MSTDRITWCPARNSKRSGFLEHKFTMSGPNAQAVRDWLLPNAPVGTGFTFRIHENHADPEAARRTRGHISHLKLSSASVAYMQWHEHGRA